MRLVDLLEHRATVERQLAVAIKVNGSEIDIPTQDGDRAEFDAALRSEPAPLSPSMQLLREWGLI